MTALQRLDTTDSTDLATAPTSTLRDELARGLTLVADHLMRLATIWAELERRGEDLADLRRGIARTLPLIASGRLAAEAVVAFAGRPVILRSLEGVPVEQQRRFAAGEVIEVVDPDRPATTLSLPLAALPARAIRIAFDDGEVRSPAAQRLTLRRPQKKQDDSETDRRFHPAYDPATGLVTVGRMQVELAELMSVLAAASGPDRPLAADIPEEYKVVRVRLSNDEHARLLEAAKKAGLPDWELGRKALRAFGII